MPSMHPVCKPEFHSLLIFSTVVSKCILMEELRTQLYPLGRNNYPTLVQKHFNGAAPWIDVSFSKCYKFQRIEPTSCGSLATSLGGWWCSKEAAVLAKWLKGVTLAIAEANPNDEHAALFSLKISRVVKLKQNNFVLSWWVNIWMWEIHLGCELHFLWIWWLCDHVYQRTAILVLCWLRRTVQSSFVQIFFSTVLTIALCLYQGATKAVKKWLNFGWTDFFVCCKVCWGLSREALEMELLLYKVRPKYHQLLGSEETSILSAHGAGTILCWPFFWCGESKAWPFGHRPKPVLQPNGIKHIWWWRFCR